MTPSFLRSACLHGEPLFAHVEVALKGKEAALPEGFSFEDKDGHVRTETRLRWYAPIQDQTFRTYALTDQIACEEELDAATTAAAEP